MRGTFHDMAILLVVSALLLVPSFAGAEITITYSGETPIGSGEDNQGIGALGDVGNYSSSLWDYVYNLSESGPGDSSENSDGGPWYWGIRVDEEPEHYYNTEFDPEGYYWRVRWDDDIEFGEWGGTFNDSNLMGHSAVFWSWIGERNAYSPTTGTFHFQSSWGPGLRAWVATGDDAGTYSGADQEWSASPEPASMALSGLALLGVGFWRRRKKTA